MAKDSTMIQTGELGFLLSFISALLLLTGSSGFLLNCHESVTNSPTAIKQYGSERWFIYNAPHQTQTLFADKKSYINEKNDHDDNQQPSIQANNQPSNIYVVPWDGCLIPQTQKKMELGLKAAFQVWPELEIWTRGADLQWLYNKVEALQHVLVPPAQAVGNSYRYHPAVEYAIAIRMLLEEQELDEGQSNGSTGKYGSKFHPSADDPAFVGFENTSPDIERQQQLGKQHRLRKRRRQRPLTVGEITVNWKDTLREAALIRYYQEEGEDPLNLLNEAVLQTKKHEKSNGEMNQVTSSPKMADPLMIEILNCFNPATCSSDFDARVIIGVYHESDLGVAKASIQDMALASSDRFIAEKHIVECKRTEDAIAEIQKGNIPILCLGSDDSTYKELLFAAPKQSTVHVLESYWSRLQDLIFPLFGDHIPRQATSSRIHGGLETDRAPKKTLIGKCVAPDRLLQLRLCEWCSDPNGQAAATMNAWTTTLTSQEWGQELGVNSCVVNDDTVNRSNRPWR